MQAVLKFGGAALADGAAIRQAVERVGEWASVDGGNPRRSGSDSRPIVVVSALLGVTDGLGEVARQAALGPSAARASMDLAGETVRIRHRSVLSQLGLPSELLDRHWRDLRMLLAGIAQRGRLDPQNRDLVLSYGERMSARIFAAALNAAGYGATPVDAWDVGLVTDSNHGHARPLQGTGQAIGSALRSIPGIAVVTGFLAKDGSGHLTTLGRNGSDLTASLLAEAAGASELVFYKDVPGILSADPRALSGAEVLSEVTYAEATELAFHGAQLLHPASLAPAIRAGVPVRFVPLRSGASGTRLVTHLERIGPAALAWTRSVLRVRYDLSRPEHRGASLAAAFKDLESAGLTPTMTAIDGCGLTVYARPGNAAPAAAAAVDGGFATLALVGHGIGQRAALAAGVLAVLAEAGITPLAVQLGGSEHSLVLALEGNELRAAREILHREVIVQPEPVFQGDLPEAPGAGYPPGHGV